MLLASKPCPWPQNRAFGVAAGLKTMPLASKQSFRPCCRPQNNADLKTMPLASKQCSCCCPGNKTILVFDNGDSKTTRARKKCVPRTLRIHMRQVVCDDFVAHEGKLGIFIYKRIYKYTYIYVQYGNVWFLLKPNSDPGKKVYPRPSITGPLADEPYSRIAV